MNGESQTIRLSISLVLVYSLRGIDLSSVDVFTHLDLHHASLTEVDFSKADLGGASLVNVNLTRSNLRGANLAGTDLLVANS